MECGLALSLLSNFLAEELTEEAASQLRAHLLCCRRCAWETESLRQSASALRQYESRSTQPPSSGSASWPTSSATTAPRPHAVCPCHDAAGAAPAARLRVGGER